MMKPSAEAKMADTPRILTVVSCGSSKQSLAPGKTVPARELYTSAIHSCKDTYGRHSDAYYIASAKYGLVEHDDELPEYDLRLSELPESKQQEWAEDLVDSLQDAVDEHDVGAIVFIGGKEYVSPILNAAAEDTLSTPLYTPWQSLKTITGSGKGMAWCNDEDHWPVNLDTLDEDMLGPARLSD